MGNSDWIKEQAVNDAMTSGMATWKFRLCLCFLFFIVCVHVCTHVLGAWTHVCIHEHQLRMSGFLVSWSSSFSLEATDLNLMFAILLRPPGNFQDLPVSHPPSTGLTGSWPCATFSWVLRRDEI